MTSTPTRLNRLPELANDLWWTWNPAREAFRRLDYTLWRQTSHNAVLLLHRITPETLERAASDPAYLAVYDAAIGHSMPPRRPARGPGGARTSRPDAAQVVAYFSAEFAIHQSLPIYAGGLGVLAGDHCKEASDLGVPLVGVGFMYPQGYFRQRVSPEGWQQEAYERINWTDAPVQPARTIDGQSCVVLVPFGTRSVLVQVWEVQTRPHASRPARHGS